MNIKDILIYLGCGIGILAVIFLFTWIIFGLYLGLPFYNVCYWFMLVLIGMSILAIIGG